MCPCNDLQYGRGSFLYARHIVYGQTILFNVFLTLSTDFFFKNLNKSTVGNEIL